MICPPRSWQDLEQSHFTPIVLNDYAISDASFYVFSGLRNRISSPNDMNEFSSRSHTMLQLMIDNEIPDPDDENLYITKHGKLTFVDLAGELFNISMTFTLKSLQIRNFWERWKNQPEKQESFVILGAVIQCSPTFPSAGRCFGHRKPGKHSTRRTQRVLDDPKPNDEYEGPSQDCWSTYIFFNQIHYFMVRINTFFVEWWSGPTMQCRPAGA
jgi:hypothetical protein